MREIGREMKKKRRMKKEKYYVNGDINGKGRVEREKSGNVRGKE